MKRPRTEEQTCGRRCAQRVCTVGVHRGEVVYLLVCFALIKLHSVFIIHNFLQKFCRLPFYYVREVCVCGGVLVCGCRLPRRSEAWAYLEAGVVGSCEPPRLSAGNQARLLQKSTECSSLSSHLYST